MKAFFPKRIDGSFCPCPFVGFRANSPEEFKEILKRHFFNKETGYPGLYFSTADPNAILLFAGHQYEHPEGTPFKLFYKNHDGVSELNNQVGWFSLKDSDHWFDLLDDAEVIDNKISVLNKIVQSQGGLTIEIK